MFFSSPHFFTHGGGGYDGAGINKYLNNLF
jgi:hypothetical protein